MNFFESLNGFVGQYSHLISLLVAISTLVAVIIALWNSIANNRILKFQIKFTCQLSKVIQMGGGDIDRKSVTANLKNVGHRDTTVGYFNFFAKFPFSTSGFILTPLTDYRAQPEGVSLNAGRMANIELQSQDSFAELLINEAPTIFPRWRSRKISISVSLPTGESFRAKLSKELKREITEKTKKLPVFFIAKNQNDTKLE